MSNGVADPCPQQECNALVVFCWCVKGVVWPGHDPRGALQLGVNAAALHGLLLALCSCRLTMMYNITSIGSAFHASGARSCCAALARG